MTRETATTNTIEHLIGPAGRLTIKLADWDVELVAGTDETVRVRDAAGGGLPDDLDVDRGPDMLSIRQPSRFPGIGFVLGSGDGSRRLAIEVPVRTALTVQTASGDVSSSGLGGTQQYRTASGELHLDRAAGDITAETMSGDIAVEVDGTIGLAIKTVSGDVSVTGGLIERIRLTTTSGDVRLTSDLGPGPHAIATVSGDATLNSHRGLRITALTVAGDLRSDLPHRSLGGPGRRSLVVGDGAAELQFRSVSGDLRVLDPAAPAPPRPLAPPVAPPPAPAAMEASPIGEAGKPDDREEARLDILRALEKGEIDVAEATERLAALDGATNA